MFVMSKFVIFELIKSCLVHLKGDGYHLLFNTTTIFIIITVSSTSFYYLLSYRSIYVKANENFYYLKI